MGELSESIITHVSIQGFRSLRDVRVDLGNLTVLVGPNGSGKSTFLDALAFLKESLETSPHTAFANRGGVDQVRTRTATATGHISIRVSLASREAGRFRGEYHVRIRPQPRASAFTVEEESCSVFIGAEQQPHRFVVRRSQWVTSTEGVQPSLSWNRLALPLLSGITYFEPVYKALTGMRFYAFDPAAVAAPNEQAEGLRLAPDGGNAANVLRNLRAADGVLYQIIVDWVGRIVPGIHAVVPRTRNREVTILFEEEAAGGNTVAFDARVMSEGTLRALALLLAVYQADPSTLIALEEPETAVYPNTAAVVADILSEAALSSQILVTTHSSDLIDHIAAADLRVVERQNGQTVIAPIDPDQQAIVDSGLFSFGELHRLEGLSPAPDLRAVGENSA